MSKVVVNHFYINLPPFALIESSAYALLHCRELRVINTPPSHHHMRQIIITITTSTSTVIYPLLMVLIERTSLLELGVSFGNQHVRKMGIAVVF